MLAILIAAVVSSAPLVAPPPPVDAAAASGIADDRLAAARRLIAITLPPGSLARMTNNIAPGTMARVLAGVEAADPARAQHAADPVYQARLRRASDLLVAELVKVQAQSEPMYFDAFAVAYARRFTVAELGEIIAFVSTPAGLRYAASQGALAADPAVQAALDEMARRRTAAMPAMLAKVAAVLKADPAAPATVQTHVP